MASSGLRRLTTSAAQPIAATTTLAKSAMLLQEVRATLIVIATNESSVNHSVQFEHSPDGINWVNLGSAKVVTTDGLSTPEDITVNIMPNVRAVITVTAGSADYDLRIHYDKDK